MAKAGITVTMDMNIISLIEKEAKQKKVFLLKQVKKKKKHRGH